MKLLLDTQALLWWLTDDARLSVVARKHIAQVKNDIFVSAASALEIAAKHRLGKLGLADTIMQRYPILLAEQGFLPLPIKDEHALLAGSYPQPHRDPFDRMLVAQASLEKLTVVSCDPALQQFDVALLW